MENEIIITENVEVKAPSSFKTKYYKNPEYREKHLNYCKDKVLCPSCNVLVSRCNMAHHKKTTKHIRFEEILKLKESLNSAESIKKDLLMRIEQAFQN